MNKEKTVSIPKFMRAKQLAKHFGIGLSTVWLYSHQKRISPICVSPRVTIFNVEEVEKALTGGTS